jgi:predicted alpha/beta-hydrolase family hydrolase
VAISFLHDGSTNAKTTILLAHGAGAPMDSGPMNGLADALSSHNFKVARFEFDYMAERRRSTKRAPPPKGEKLIPEYRAAIEQLAASGPLIIGGKSMGGRVASMIGDEFYAQGKIIGLLCLGYPFHPTKQPLKLRTAHLEYLKTPTLICQGSRDPFGSVEEVANYKLSSAIELFWLNDGDHDFTPRKSLTGLTSSDHLSSIAAKTREWADGLSS